MILFPLFPSIWHCYRFPDSFHLALHFCICIFLKQLYLRVCFSHKFRRHPLNPQNGSTDIHPPPHTRTTATSPLVKVMDAVPYQNFTIAVFRHELFGFAGCEKSPWWDGRGVWLLRGVVVSHLARRMKILFAAGAGTFSWAISALLTAQTERKLMEKRKSVKHLL